MSNTPQGAEKVCPRCYHEHPRGAECDWPTPARDAVERLSREAQDVENARLLVMGVCEDAAVLDGRATKFTLALITTARADERAQLAARATDQERGMVRELADLASCDGASEAEDFSPETLATEQAILAALTASRERGIGDAASIAQGYAALARRMADTGGERMALSIACDIRALAAPAVADTTAPEVAASAAPQRSGVDYHDWPCGVRLVGSALTLWPIKDGCPHHGFNCPPAAPQRAEGEG